MEEEVAVADKQNSHQEKFKLVIFGATGRTGKEVVKQALERGHHVTAVVRTPEKLTIKHENLELVQGDACDLESFAPALEGKDAVLSSLGSFGSIFNPTTFYSESIHAIMEGMKRHKITRLVAVTSWCTQPGPNNNWFVEWILKPLFLNGVLKNMAVMEKMLEESCPEEMNYTIVRPCQLLEGERSGNYKVEEGQCNTGTSRKITCGDVAEFMLKTLETAEYDRKGLAVAGLSTQICSYMKAMLVMSKVLSLLLTASDAVMSGLGVFASIFNPTTFYSESMQAILEGMKRCGLKRLVTMTAWCTQPGPNNKWLVDWIINPLLLNGMIKDMTTMEKVLEKTDADWLDYTIVRPCCLVNGERTGRYKIEEGQCNTGTRYFITRADVAQFMLNTLESNSYNRKGFAVAGL
ncbi:uncharacterized protein ycf39-like [Acropora millepora]|uniref:uncharacterized protein ycf39-like n=1 Tax=Acropora millepora TaxID=45264 RepID=UPI001CF47BE4|nr:uncharacterized protein ycf39-like [Acropora millepora]